MLRCGGEKLKLLNVGGMVEAFHVEERPVFILFGTRETEQKRENAIAIDRQWL